ncbi:hypothetical protein KHM83_19305 [Fusibacter paucivorans]|uniref:PA14 domain-containing protein n=1 Tax=Fusibacter paucivorans TaxID=76009 RepID=A0ABS5PUI4_9FIRM|nr:hypothetical protein [Fusibacter paucivorans]MBS7528819.1 hypothetical protein [Fusibacter paucivorans]
MDYSHASVMLYIDGKPIEEGAYTFTKGRHKITCYLANDWHTANLFVTFNTPTTALSTSELTTLLTDLASETTAINYVGIYESKDNHTVTVNLENYDTDVILFLSSYRALQWQILNPNNIKIKAVVYSCHLDGVSVDTTNLGNTPIIKYDGLINTFEIYPLYQKVGHSYHVEYDTFLDLNQQIKALTGYPLDGFTGEYATESLSAPEVVLDDAEYEAINNAYDTLNALLAKDPQRPDNLFGDASIDHSWAHFQSDAIKASPNAYTAYFFNTNTPDDIKGIETVDQLSIDESGKLLYGIPYNDLGIYYVTSKTFDAKTTQNIHVEESWAFIRILVDGKVVYSSWEHYGGNFELTFEKGTHLIECEFINDWHTAEFQVDF